jgi:WD40 repeat protein
MYKKYGLIKLSILFVCLFIKLSLADNCLITDSNLIHQTVQTFNAKQGSVFSVAFNSDGNEVISGGSNGTVKIWDIEKHSEIMVFPKFLNPGIRHVSFSPDGKSFLAVGHNSGYLDQKIKLFDIKTCSELIKLENCQEYCSCAVFCPDGKHILAADTVRGGMIMIWDTVTGKQVTKFRDPGRCVLDQINFSFDGKRFIIGNVIRDSITGQQLLALQEKCPMCAAFSPDGKKVVTGYGDGQIRVWDSNTGLMIKGFSGHQDRIYSVAFSPDGKYFATSGGIKDPVVRVWDAINYTEIITLTGHTDYVFSVDISPNGHKLVSGSGDGTIRFWNLTDPDKVEK